MAYNRRDDHQSMTHAKDREVQLSSSSLAFSNHIPSSSNELRLQSSEAASSLDRGYH